MTGIVLPGMNGDGMQLLTGWVPECLIPLVGKPLLDHQIELFVRNGITRIVVVVTDRLYEVEEYFSKGERWGVQLKYVMAAPGQPLSAYLEMVEAHLDETPVVAISAVTSPAFPLAGMLKEFQRGEHTSLITHDDGGVRFPVVVGRQVLTECIAQKISSLSDFTMNFKSGLFSSGLTFVEISDLPGFLAINRALLTGEQEGVSILSLERSPGIWVGRNSTIAASAKLTPPVLIGANCQIRDNVEISGAVVCDRVVIDTQAHVADSVILENTFIGSHTEVVRAVVRKNCIISVDRGVVVTVTDPIILADLAEAIPEDHRQRFFDLITATTLAVLFSPVLVLMFLADLILPSLNLMGHEQCYGNRETPTLSGAHLKKTFVLRQFRFGPLVVRKLPGLLSVIRGDLTMVGAKPLSNEELAEITGKWQELRQDTIRGLFHIWEAEGEQDASFEERLVMENFYAATRSWKDDMKILLKMRV